MAEYKTIKFKSAKDKHQVFIIPTVGVINDTYYFGYPVYSIAFAWLIWRCKVMFGVRRWRADNG